MQNREIPGTGSLFPIWLVRSKAHPTLQRVALLQRPSLTRRLDRALDARLSLMHAPAGYGKSTVLGGWRAQLLEAGHSVCWLSLDREDNDHFQLLTYIAYSLAEGGISFAAAGVEEQTFYTDLPLRSLLSIITAAVAGHSGKVVLILDDFECLDAGAVNKVIQPLLNYAPDNLHIAVGTRDDSLLQIADLETKGLAVRVGAGSLKFTREEIETFLADHLDRKAIRQVHTLTEGWPVVVQMIKVAVAGERDIERILTHIKGSATRIADYLSEQIFNNLEPQIQTFLMDISLVDRVDCDFANHLRDAPDSLRLFKSIRTLNTLLLPVDQVEETYRLHPIFREYLYQKLTILEPARRTELHLRAAHWYANRGDLVAAVRQAMRADNPRAAIGFIEATGGVMLWLKEGLARLRAAVDLLGETVVMQAPRMMLILCILRVKDGKVYQARQIYNAAVRLSKTLKDQLTAEQDKRLTYELTLMETVLTPYEGGQVSESHCHALLQTIEAIPPTEHLTIGHHYTLLCISHMQRGQFQYARTYAEKAIPEFKQFGSIYGETYIYFHLGDICFAEGKAEAADQFYRQGLTLARQHFNADKGIKMVAYVLLAELNYERNQIDNLPGVIESIPRQLEEHEAWFDIYAAGYTTSSNVEYGKYGIEAALAVIDGAMDYVASQKLSRLANLLHCQKIDLLLRAARVTEARQVLDSAGLQLSHYKDPIGDNIAWREHDAAVQAITRLMIREGRFEQALPELAYHSKHARESGHLRSCIRYAILQSTACAKTGDAVQMLAHLDDALTLARKSGFIRAFLDEGSDIEKILSHYLAVADDSTFSIGNREQAQRLVELLAPAVAAETRAAPLLSKREEEVMAQLTEGFSNKVIARNIGISENTVRFHLKNIYAKLHVDSRLQAVAAVRKLYQQRPE